MIRCSICKGKSKKWKKKEDYQLYKCSICKHIFHNRKSDCKKLQKTYSKDYYYEWEKDEKINRELRKQAAKVKKKIFFKNMKGISELPLQTMTLIEIGAAMGSFIEEIKDAFSDVYGQDISIYAVEEMKKKGIKATDKSILDIDKVQSYDMVIMWDVIEHFDDPIRHLKAINNLLNDGGILYATTPNMKSITTILQKERRTEIDPEEHINYFNPESIRIALEKSGFRLIRLLPSSREQRHAFLSLFTLLKRAVPCSKSIEANIRVVQQKRSAKFYRLFCCMLGSVFWMAKCNDNMTVIAMKDG